MQTERRHWSFLHATVLLMFERRLKSHFLRLFRFSGLCKWLLLTFCLLPITHHRVIDSQNIAVLLVPRSIRSPSLPLIDLSYIQQKADFMAHNTLIYGWVTDLIFLRCDYVSIYRTLVKKDFFFNMGIWSPCSVEEIPDLLKAKIVFDTLKWEDQGWQGSKRNCWLLKSPLNRMALFLLLENYKYLKEAYVIVTPEKPQSLPTTVNTGNCFRNWYPVREPLKYPTLITRCSVKTPQWTEPETFNAQQQ